MVAVHKQNLIGPLRQPIDPFRIGAAVLHGLAARKGQVKGNLLLVQHIRRQKRKTKIAADHHIVLFRERWLSRKSPGRELPDLSRAVNVPEHIKRHVSLLSGRMASFLFALLPCFYNIFASRALMSAQPKRGRS